jgi:hypothetical protein
VRACYAALRMQDSVKRYAEVIQRVAGVPIQIRVGLNSGEVVVRSIGSDLHMDYTAVGQTDVARLLRDRGWRRSRDDPRRIAGRLLQMDESFREVLPFVFDLFGVPDPANPSPAIDPEQRQKRIHGVLKRILHDPAYGGLRVILLEDLHWFDGASDAYLETTVDSVPATRDLLLVTFRPEYQAR